MKLPQFLTTVQNLLSMHSNLANNELLVVAIELHTKRVRTKKLLKQVEDSQIHTLLETTSPPPSKMTVKTLTRNSFVSWYTEYRLTKFVLNSRIFIPFRWNMDLMSLFCVRFSLRNDRSLIDFGGRTLTYRNNSNLLIYQTMYIF